MSISYVLVLLGLGIFGCAVWAMFWAIDDGQYDDLESHGKSILEDEDANGDIPELPVKRDVPLWSDQGPTVARHVDPK